MNANLTRRHFILTTTSAVGGFMIGIGTAPAIAEAAIVVAQPWNEDNAYAANEIDAWIAIDPDDSILIRYPRSEMGQGSMTALPMILTEELHCDWSKVRVEYASANRNVRENKLYGPMISAGSRTVRGTQKKMQQVGASARERLIAAAAARWGVPTSECTAASSVVSHGPSGRTLPERRLIQRAASTSKAVRFSRSKSSENRKESP
jgi:isoquinoline 1-oxidoreductase subunit beta